MTKNKKVFTITLAVAMVAAIVGVAAYDNNVTSMQAEKIMDSMTFEVFPAASAVSSNTTIEVGAYIVYNCWYGFGKCSTTTIYSDVGAGETFNTQALVPNVWGTLSDLEMHHKLKNNSGENLVFKGEHWGTIQDYSAQASIICNDNVVHKSTYTIANGKQQDVRFCVIQNVSENDLASWTFKLV